MKIYILDAGLKLLPVGIAGEIWIGGVGVSMGYLNNAALTADRFRKDIFAEEGLMYKSGDLAKWLPDGNIAYIGRTDNQVKVRGFRIELGEIENRVSRHEQIKEAAVIVWEKGGDQQLVCYYVPKQPIEASALRRYLSERLPDYMVPAYYVRLDDMPLNPSGKLDRRALPKPEIDTGLNYSRPANETQKQLIIIWAEVLDLREGDIGIHTNFFDIGGNSLKLVNVLNKINRQFQTSISVASMFKYPEIALLAGLLTEKPVMATGEPDSAMLSELGQRDEAFELYNRLLNS
jgi:acyl carrier protein